MPLLRLQLARPSRRVRRGRLRRKLRERDPSLREPHAEADGTVDLLRRRHAVADGPAVGRAILRLSANWPISRDAEITLEANPTSVEADRFRGYRAAGVNRVSLGVQSLRDGAADGTRAPHTVDEAVAAVRLAQSIFPRTQLRPDLRAAETDARRLRDELLEGLWLARRHLALPAHHRGGTRYYDLHRAGKLKMPNEELAADLFELTQDLTKEAGLPAYEISNHARPGRKPAQPPLLALR